MPDRSTAQTDSAHDRPTKRPRADGANPSLRCHVCGRMYERPDHLNRHLDSHRNERSFRCRECPAAFNRKDLLVRHETSHGTNRSSDGSGRDRTATRAVKACGPCVGSKVKCDNERPCRRCVKRSIPCMEKASRSPGGSIIEQHSGHHRDGLTLPLSSEEPHQFVAARQHLAVIDPTIDHMAVQSHVDSYSGNTLVCENFDIPAFFEHIMVAEPDWMRSDVTLPPPDLSEWIPDIDWFDSADLFGVDFALSIDQTLQTRPAINDYFLSSPSEVPDANAESSGQAGNDASRRRHVAFQQSPWLWIPERNQNAFSENESIALDERHVDFASSPHQPFASDVVIRDRLSLSARDRIFKLVVKTAGLRVSIPSFPSVECLDKLIKVGIAKRTETDAWIHPYTFDSDGCRPEYLTALVVAGCICFGIPTVSRTGLVLQEIVRLSLNELVEQDNSATQDLQYLQASMLWLDIGAFCGYRRKMVIAESSLQALVTAIRRSGRFEDGRSKAISLSPTDGEQEVEHKWHLWIEQESYKRLIYHLWEHDVNMCMVKNRQPLISYAEISLCLPAARSLWLAPTSQVWKRRLLSIQSGEQASLRSLLQDDAAILCLPSSIDMDIARSVYLHGVAAQIWEHSQQATLLNNASDPSAQLWSQTRHQRLYQSLQQLGGVLQSCAPVTLLFHEFTQMFLHVNLDIIARFAGKCGEEEAHRAYTQLQFWRPTKAARISIVHAGQVVRAARLIPPYQLRGFDSFVIYHAIMVLWTYSMLMRDHANKTAPGTPTSEFRRREQATVLLDELQSSDQANFDAFILAGRGRPCLRLVTTHTLTSPAPDTAIPDIECDLESPSRIMEVGIKLLDAALPGSSRDIGPPLLRALCGLLEELSKIR